MPRVAYGRHRTQVNLITYPDNPNYPIGTGDWNEDPEDGGLLGFTPQIIASASNVTPTNSAIILSGSANVSTIAITNTNEYDLLYVFTNGTVNLVNTSSPSVNGEIKLLADVNKLLSVTVPTILVRKGNYWYEYGGGITNALNDVGDVDITSNSSGEILVWNGSNWINNTLSESGIAPVASPTFTGTVNGSNLTLSGDLIVNGTTTTVNSTTLNVQNAVVFEGATADNFETTLSVIDPTADRTISLPDATTTLVGIDVSQTLTNKILTNPSLGASYLDITKISEPSDPSANIGRVYVKQIDGNNEGLFVKIKQSGNVVEVQLS